MVEEIVAPLHPTESSEPGITELPAVPGHRATRILIFEFVALAEYWIAPTLFGLTNYAGVWSDVGIGFFGAFVASLIVLVLLPLRRHLALANDTRRRRAVFHGVWAGAFAVGLFVTNTFQLGVVGPATRAVSLGSTTVYTPFGAWSALTVFIPAVGFFGTFDVEILSVLLLISVLGSSAIQLGAYRSRQRCETPAPGGSRWRGRLARLAVWSPLGFLTGCAACAPLYLSAVALVVPATAATGLASVPLVPWIGLAGLLYLASFGLALYLIRRATEPAQRKPPGAQE